MKIKINVTKDVLERSKMCGFVPGLITENCMLAIALKDLFPYSVVVVTTVNLLGGFGADYDQIKLPKNAIKHREIFDCLQPNGRANMSPFSFEIEVPEYVIEKIGLSQIYKVLSESPTLELVMNKEEVF